MMLDRSRRVVEILLGSLCAGLLVFLTATTGPDRRSPFAEHPLMHLIWGVLITALGALVLAERTYYVSIYSRGINWGPFQMKMPAIFRLVVATGIFLVLIGIIIGLVALRRVVVLYGF